MFIVEHNSQEREENLENTKEVVAEFEGRVNTEVRRQEEIDRTEEKNYRRGELLEKYIVKLLYRQDNRRFEKEYLRKLEKNWQRQKSVSSEEKS